ncbi:MAG: hypothetical protein NTZ40_05330 [Cyanobacteria bacterium]|nr:hypothetical protein [Cyanobacteriota bacterium]
MTDFESALRLEEFRLPMDPRDQWDLELRQYCRDLIQPRRQVAPFRQPPKLRWLDDGAGAAQWQIGDFALLANCGARARRLPDRQGVEMGCPATCGAKITYTSPKKIPTNTVGIVQ